MNGLSKLNRMSSSSFPHLPIYIIAAMTPKRGIGNKGKLPWPNISLDMQRFKYFTSNTIQNNSKNAVIMGRKTWTSLPQKMKPLQNRINVIISNTLSESDLPEGVHVAKSYDEAISILTNKYPEVVESIYIIGGEALFRYALDAQLADAIYLTRVGVNYECDCFLPEICCDVYSIVSTSHTFVENNTPYDFIVYTRIETGDKIHSNGDTQRDRGRVTMEGVVEKEELFMKKFRGVEEEMKKVRCCPSIIRRTHQEFQYLDLIADIINFGDKQEDRTRKGTLAVFGRQMRFSLKQSFPLLTTKRVFWRGVVEELLWFLRGETNGNTLAAANVKIWEKNGSREYLDSIGLQHREVGDLGPIYGFQWRHFGAAYSDMHADYTGKGIDQLKDCIDKLKTNPTDRRIILTAWNPTALREMALPPCHAFCQFFVSNGELSCMMFQRSCDMGLGVPFNIASYSLLTCLLAHICGLKRGDFVYCLGNAHIYTNHIEALKMQLEREPLPFPVLNISDEIKDIEAYKFEDFELIGYNPHRKIEMDMAV